MDSQHSESRSYDLLDERIRKWIFDQKWETLHSSQEESIPVILKASSDVIISAPTSAGKTEAAFLPALTKVLTEPLPSIRILYVGPLKALINDQFSRLDHLCEDLDIPVRRWHGDVSSSAKTALVRNPSGILLITPESLEALLMRRGSQIRTVFKFLEYCIVDEVHSYIGNERGAQLQSLMHRIEAQTDRVVPRIGLSATLKDPDLAAAFIRPDEAIPCSVIVEPGSGELKAQLKAFYRMDSLSSDDETPREHSADQQVIQYLLDAMSGEHNLIFCNRKSDVESLADALSEECRKNSRKDEFCAHHGNLSKEIRENAEARLKSRETPTTCVCTSTLEMGIDIGSMHSIGQYGPPPSVASLRQRIGRSGRRGEPAILREIVIEDAITAKSSIIQKLHLDLIESIACIELMAEGWCEPPSNTALHLSTLIQQCMSFIVERGGASIPNLYNTLVKHGSFAHISQDQFVNLLKAMKQQDILTQMEDGTLLLGAKGERIAEHYSFYCAFSTPEEYSLIGDGKPIGSLPILMPIKIGDPLIFAGIRWKIIDIDDDRKVVTMIRSRGKRPPMFDGGAIRVHCMVRQRMLEILRRMDVPSFLNDSAREMLSNARNTFTEFHLESVRLVPYGNETILFHWCGDLEAGTLRLLLVNQGLVIDPGLSVLVIHSSTEGAKRGIQRIANGELPDARELAASVGNKKTEKHDWILSEELLIDEYVAREIDIDGALEMARSVSSADASMA